MMPSGVKRAKGLTSADSMPLRREAASRRPVPCDTSVFWPLRRSVASNV
jgi:hypothetical protein